MIILDCEQGTEEWMQARIKVVSASNFKKVVTSKGEPSKQAEQYACQLAGQIISGKQDETYSSSAMERGIEMEAEAVEFLEFTQDIKTQKVGFVYKDEDKRIGCSPDRLIEGEKGLVEVKCPLVHTQVKYLMKGEFPTEYFQQVQGQLYVTGYEYCLFCSYYPGLKPLLITVKRDEAFIKCLDRELKLFVDKIDEVIKKLK